MKRYFDRSYLASITTSMLLTAMVHGCGNSGGGVNATGSGNTGAAAANAGGSPAAPATAGAGKPAGTAGTGTTTSTPTTMAGTTGGTSTPASGGAGASMAAGGSGAAAGGESLTTCGAASTMPGPMLHQAVVDAIVPKDAMNVSPCAFSSCHNTTQKKAMLNLDVGTMDLHAILVDKPSCEVPTLKLVASGGGDAALTNSWLWQKLTAPTGSSGELTAQTAWGMGGASCGQDSGQPFGVRMPKGSIDTIAPSKLDPIKAWICAGAPGPM